LIKTRTTTVPCSFSRFDIPGYTGSALPRLMLAGVSLLCQDTHGR
jgi:hypothetical protein